MAKVMPAFLREDALRAITRHPEARNVPRALAERALQKWEVEAAAERCREKADAINAIDCRCVGCLERLCFLFFDQAVIRATGRVDYVHAPPSS